MPLEIESELQENRPLLRLRGSLDAAAAEGLLRRLSPLLKQSQVVTLDLSGVWSADSAGVAVLGESVALARQHRGRLLATGATGQVREALARAPMVVAQPASPGPGIAERVGAGALGVVAAAKEFLQLLADTAYWTLIAPLRRHLPPPGATSTQALRIGVDALPIVCLIALLLGLIMAFQAAYQLRQFGANIYIANMVGISMVRELGPLMSAILVAGRSGSAISAELGTMVVGEEIDALRTMGINEIRFLVVPRVYAITITQPSVTLFADAVGILGGLLIAVLYVDLGAGVYLRQTLSALSLNDLFTGLGKSVVFAWIIVLTGCHCGLHITGGAEGVGRATTTSVVASIFAIIVADSVFTTLSTVLG